MRWSLRIACALGASLVVLVGALLVGGGAGAQQASGPSDALPASGSPSTHDPSRAPAAAPSAPVETQPVRPTPTKRTTLHARTVPTDAETTPPTSQSVSVGRHNRGRLENGREILASEHVRLKHPNGDQHHGTDELVALIEGAAATVGAQFPGSQLTVGDLSRRRGGRMRPHRSHRSGRDADIGFYVVDPQGQPVYADRFVDFRADGTTRANAEWRFDDARNWALVAAMVAQDDAPLQYVFVARWLKRRLLAHAVSIGAPQSTIDRAEAILDQPRRGGRHDDHFHIRIYCPVNDLARCSDDPPWHAWVQRPSPEELAQLRAEDRAQRDQRARSRRRRAAASERRRARRRARATAAAAEPTVPADAPRGGA